MLWLCSSYMLAQPLCRVEVGRVHLELGQVPEAVEVLEVRTLPQSYVLARSSPILQTGLGCNWHGHQSATGLPGDMLLLCLVLPAC